MSDEKSTVNFDSQAMVTKEEEEEEEDEKKRTYPYTFQLNLREHLFLVISPPQKK